MAATAKGEQSAVAGVSTKKLLLSLAKRLEPGLLPFSMAVESSKKADDEWAPAASPAVGDVGRVTIGEEIGVSMYSLPDMSPAKIDLALC
jgi:hypothetical protein